MTAAVLEHANYSVPDPDRTAQLLCDLFGWHIRWAGASLGSGRSVHVGNDTSYVALYAPDTPLAAAGDSYSTLGGLNHIGVVVDDFEATEARVKAAGLTPHNHADYEPGRRFYFDDPDGIEYEVVSYS